MMECLSGSAIRNKNVRRHVRPPVIEEHKRNLVVCVTTKAIVTFPEDKEIPIKSH